MLKVSNSLLKKGDDYPCEEPVRSNGTRIRSLHYNLESVIFTQAINWGRVCEILAVISAVVYMSQ